MSSAGEEAGGIQEMSLRLCMSRCVCTACVPSGTALAGTRQLWLSRGAGMAGRKCLCAPALEHRACLLPQPQSCAAKGI